MFKPTSLIFAVVFLLVLLAGAYLFVSKPKEGNPFDRPAGVGSFEISASDWAAFGDTRGYVEPCGCNPETDLGGLVRLRSWLQEENSNSESLARPKFCLGNMFPQHAEKPENLGKVEFIDAFLKTNVPASHVLPCLVGKIEWSQRSVLGERLRGFLLSNTNKLSDKFVSYLKLKDALVFGFLEDKDLAAADTLLLKRLKEVHAKQEELAGVSLNKVLLFSGSDAALKFFEVQEWFDLIVSSNTSGLDVEPDKKEKEKPGLLLRSESTYMVPSFGQGVIQNVTDSITKSPVRDVSFPAAASRPGEIRLGSEFEKKGSTPVFAGLRSPVFWLGREEATVLPKSDPVSKQYKRYNARQGDIFGVWLDSRQKAYKEKLGENGGNPKYVGAEACKSCHSQAYEVWTKSKHAHAHETLVNKAKHKDLECVSCHVVGFADPAGFPGVSEVNLGSSHLKNVQCENCHGPRGEHIVNPAIKAVHADPKEVCVTCHTPPHTTGFDFNARWQQIAHGMNQ